MEIEFSDTALSDFAYWKKSGNKVIEKRIVDLLNSIKEAPFLGIGKPEALRYNFSGLE